MKRLKHVALLLVIVLAGDLGTGCATTGKAQPHTATATSATAIRFQRLTAIGHGTSSLCASLYARDPTIGLATSVMSVDVNTVALVRTQDVNYPGGNRELRLPGPRLTLRS